MEDALAISSLLGPGNDGAVSTPKFDASLLQRQESFADALGRAARVETESTPEARARRGAEQLVAAAFIQPLLSQLRNSSDAAPPFAPTQGEKQFRALTDAKLAHDIVRASRLPIVERLANDLLKRVKTGSSSNTEAAGKGVEAVG